MSNTITIELCTEDRARIDNLTAALIANGGAVEALLKQLQPTGDDIAKMAAAVVSPENASQRVEETTQAETPATEDLHSPTGELPPWEATAPAAEAKTEPAVTLPQIQQKVMQLVTGFNGAKKAQVREIVNAYAKKVSDIPEDKWGEVWDKLAKLESES